MSAPMDPRVRARGERALAAADAALDRGRLPLHRALVTAASAAVLRRLLPKGGRS